MGDGAGREGSTIHTHKQRKELNSHDSDHNDRKNDCMCKENSVNVQTLYKIQYFWLHMYKLVESQKSGIQKPVDKMHSHI